MAADFDCVDLHLEVVPGVSIGPFALGTPLRDVAILLHGDPVRFGTVDIPDYDWRSGPTAPGLRMSVPTLGVVLRFTSGTQQLSAIEAIPKDFVDLMYRGAVLAGRSELPTFQRLYDLLGPTLPGDARPADGQYVLRYRGLDVVFLLPLGVKIDGDAHPLALADGCTPVAARIVVCEPTRLPNAIEGVQLMTTLPKAGDKVHLLWGLGIRIGGTCLRFGASPQDIAAALGSPARVYPKTDDRMTIHGGRTAPASFVMCYPRYGLDLVFGAAIGSLEKIVVQNAISDHEGFLQYHRCWFSLPLYADSNCETAAAWLGASQDSIDCAVQRSMAQCRGEDVPNAEYFDHSSTWNSIVKILKSSDYVIPRSLIAGPSATMSALNGIVFNVSRSGALHAVTLVRPGPPIPVGAPAPESAPGTFYDVAESPRVHDPQTDFVDAALEEPSDERAMSSKHRDPLQHIKGFSPVMTAASTAATEAASSLALAVASAAGKAISRSPLQLPAAPPDDPAPSTDIANIFGLDVRAPVNQHAIGVGIGSTTETGVFVDASPMLCESVDSARNLPSNLPPMSSSTVDLREDANVATVGQSETLGRSESLVPAGGCDDNIPDAAETPDTDSDEKDRGVGRTSSGTKSDALPLASTPAVAGSAESNEDDHVVEYEDDFHTATDTSPMGLPAVPVKPKPSPGPRSVQACTGGKLSSAGATPTGTGVSSVSPMDSSLPSLPLAAIDADVDENPRDRMSRIIGAVPVKKPQPRPKKLSKKKGRR